MDEIVGWPYIESEIAVLRGAPTLLKRGRKYCALERAVI